jgi:lysozyme family protein
MSDISHNPVDRFIVCLPYTLRQECNVFTGTDADWNNPRNFDNDPDDTGGATQCGITHYDYSRWLNAHGLPDDNVRNIKPNQGRDIYESMYWFPHCPVLPVGVDLMFFDTAVNMGALRAVMLLQSSLDGLTVDGGWGPLTAAAVAAIKPADVPRIIRDEQQWRAQAYRSFTTFWKFGTDWIRRDNEISAAALKMTGEANV